MRSLVIALMVFVLSSCSSSKVLEKALTTQERAVIHGAIDDIARGDEQSLARKMPPELSAKVLPVMGRMHALLPAPPLEVTLTNANWTTGQAARELHAVYRLHGGRRWVLVEATTETANGKTLLTGIYVTPTAGNPQELNGFSLANASLSRWAMLAAMVAAVAVTIAALVRIWRTDHFERQWLWTIGALVGIMSLKLNWSTGQFSFQPLSFQLFSAGAVKQPVYAPWVLSVAFPLFAIIALFRRGDETAERIDDDAADAAPQSDMP